MRKLYVFVAVLALGLLAVANASATLWLKRSTGTSLTAPENSVFHGNFELKHKGGLVGNLTVLCSILADGTAGPGAEDKIEKILNLNGEQITATKKLSCVVDQSENGNCHANELILVVPKNLNWKSKLVLVGTTTYDNLEGAGVGEPGYEIFCSVVEITCTGDDRARFDENLANGALVLFLEELKAKCSEGGESVLKGMFEVLGQNVS